MRKLSKSEWNGLWNRSAIFLLAIAVGVAGLLPSGPARAETEAIVISGDRILIRERLGRARIWFKSRGAEAAGVRYVPGQPSSEGARVTIFDTADPDNRGVFTIGRGRLGPARGWRRDDGERAWFVNRSARNGVGTQVRRSMIETNHRLNMYAMGMGDDPEHVLDLSQNFQGHIGVQYEVGDVTMCAWFRKFKYNRRADRVKLVGRVPIPAAQVTCPFDFDPGDPTDPPNPPLPDMYFDFAPAIEMPGRCGEMRDANGGLLRHLDCGLLYIGGGGSILTPSGTPDGAPNRFGLECGTGPECNIIPVGTRDPAFECTDTGCPFGTPVPIPAAGATSCVFNTFAEPASGTLNLDTGEAAINVSLSSQVFLTGNAAEPCSLCSATGTPEAPGEGICTSGEDEGEPCRSANSMGLSKDCRPDGTHNLGTIPVDLSPLTTGPASMSAANGIFCPGQSFGGFGCLGLSTCRSFEERGAPAGMLLDETPADVTLASAFCIPATAAPLINFSANLPGPGATSLIGTLTVFGTETP